MRYLSNKRILVTGACGTVGQELIRQLLEDGTNPEEVIGIDNRESELFFLDQRYLHQEKARFVLCDIMNINALKELVRGVDVVFHCAALKHVIMCERSPSEAVHTNIIGIQNLIKAAMSAGVAKVIFTSSDKAVNPTNVMGTSKLMGERLITAANSGQREQRTVFASTRFGNVMGSSGSVIPIFRRQIASGGPLTVTDPEMTRFFMSVSEAVSLVISSAELARGGEVFITKMPVVRIRDLADVMIQELADKSGREPGSIEIKHIGIKPGEKLYEELMSDEETRRAIELKDYFAVLPAFRSIYNDISYDYPDVVSSEVSDPYISSKQAALNAGELLDLLKKNHLLDEEPGQELPSQRYWPGDKEAATERK